MLTFTPQRVRDALLHMAMRVARYIGGGAESRLIAAAVLLILCAMVSDAHAERRCARRQERKYIDASEREQRARRGAARICCLMSFPLRDAEERLKSITLCASDGFVMI